MFLKTALCKLLASRQDWTKKTATEAEVQVFILDSLYEELPRPPFTAEETEAIDGRVYEFVWQKSASGSGLVSA